MYQDSFDQHILLSKQIERYNVKEVIISFYIRLINSEKKDKNYAKTSKVAKKS